MKKFKIKSFCKINLSLRVLKKLSNGYHNIKSLVTFCDLHDVISISKIKGAKDKISFSGRFKKGIEESTEGLDKVLASTNKLIQRVEGKPITKSGFSKGKDIKK